MSARVFSSRLRGAALVVTGLVALTGCGSIYDVQLPGGAKVGKNPMIIHVEFRDVLDLVPQTTVKVDDVTIGRVTAIKLKGYTADVTLKLPRNVDLPDNAQATIRQTSLLGEKFVSLSPPAVNPSSAKLGNGDVIPLSRTGRNPEVEEVLGALSLLLNGGGVGQLKTIASELNNAFDGREADVRSVLDQLHIFVGQLDANKQAIVTSIDSLNRLAVQLRKQDGTIKSALDNLPAAIRSINSQRTDLVKTLKALQNLSGIGVRVIQASKQATINSLRDLAPTLDQLANAGQDLPNSLQVALTYPFVDEAVGRDPQVARNLHMGDFTNLSARLDLNVTKLPTLPSVSLPAPVQTVCQVTKAQVEQVTSVVNENIATVLPPPVFTQAQRDAVSKKILPGLVGSINCQDPLNGLTNLGQVIIDAFAALFPNAAIPTVIPSISIPPLGVPNLGGVLGGLGRVGTSYAGDGVAGDALNGPAGDAATLGYNSTLGALLLQGVRK